jgi:hypothetical protein
LKQLSPDFRMIHSPWESSSGRIVLSGASGMIGSALASAFAAAGYQPVRLVRRLALAADEIQWQPGADPLLADPAPLEGAAAVVHLGGANIAQGRWTPARRRLLHASRIDSTRALARLLASLRRPPKVFFVASATGFYGDRGDELLDENSQPGHGFLASLCLDWEAASFAASRAGIPVLHLRTGVVLSPGQGALARLVPLFRLGLGGRLGSGRQWMSWISLTDLTRAILFLLAGPPVSGPVNLTAPNPVTNLQFTHTLARQLHRPVFLPVPAPLLRLALGQMADETLLASARAYPARLSTAGFTFTHPLLASALEVMLGHAG